MLAENEYLVNNKSNRVGFEKMGSEIKELIEFKGAFHELQKEPIKDQVHQKVMCFIKCLLADKKNVKPFGTFDPKSIRYGLLKKRFWPSHIRKIAIIGLIVYLLLGLL